MAQMMNTIQGTFDRCRAENIGVSKNLIRTLANSGAIPTVLVGRSTRLINYDVLLQYLRNGGENEKPQSLEIKRQDENIRPLHLYRR